MSTLTWDGIERRRSGVASLRRAWWAANRALTGFMAGLPCNLPLVGHYPFEIPYSFKSRAARASGDLEFRCKRCHLNLGMIHRVAPGSR